MTSSAPKPTDPRKVIAAQSEANTKALGESQAANQVNQNNPYGQQSWQLLGYDQNGNPQYGMSQQYNPQEQSLKNFMTGSQSIGGAQGNELWNNLSNSGMYDQPLDYSTGVGTKVGERLGQMTSYLEPFQQKQIQDLDNTMRNQGLVPGMEAYDEEMRRARDTQQQGVQSMLAQFQPQAHDQVSKEYLQPIALGQELAKFGSPQPLTFGQTPQYAQNAANATQAYGNYDAQRMAQWQANQGIQSGLFQGLGALGGAAFGMPGLGLAGMFGTGGSEGIRGVT